MAAYRRVYDSRHLQADCQEPGSAPEPIRSVIEYGLSVILPFYHGNTAGMGKIFAGIPWDGDKSYGSTVGMGTIVQQTAVLKLRSYSYYSYQSVCFAAYAGTSVYLLDNSQYSSIKQILLNLYFHNNTYYHDTSINDYKQLLK